MAPDDGITVPAVSENREGVTITEIGAFYEKEMPRLVMFVRALSTILDGHAAADVAQTAFERALPRWASLRNPKAWLYKVAHHEALARCEAIRREMPADTVPDRPDQMSAALAAEWRDEQREVMAHLQTLAPKQRQVMTWTLAGFHDAQIAEALGLSTDAVKANRRYARTNLKKRLGPGQRGKR